MEPMGVDHRRNRMRPTSGLAAVAPLGVLAAAVTAALLIAGCAAPAATTQASGPAASIASPVIASSASSASPALSSSAPSAGSWGIQDRTLATARTIPCGPKPHGTDAGLARELADSSRYDHSPYPGPPTAQPTLASPTPSPPPVPGQLELEDLTLMPPPPATKPAACVDVALDALRAQAEGIGDAQPARVWLAVLSAQSPAGINADGTDAPYFTKVLAWLFYFDDLPPLCPAGGPAGPSGSSPLECDTATMGPSSALLSVDATTAEPLTNEYSGGPIFTP